MTRSHGGKLANGVAPEKSSSSSTGGLGRVIGWHAATFHLAETWRYFRQLNGLEVSAAYFAMIGGCL